MKSIDELLNELPKMIGNNYHNGCYILSEKDDQIGWLTLHYEGGNFPWKAFYQDTFGVSVCMNPKNEKPPYNNAIAYGDTPNEALQKLYDWCIENKFIEL